MLVNCSGWEGLSFVSHLYLYLFFFDAEFSYPLYNYHNSTLKVVIMFSLNNISLYQSFNDLKYGWSLATLSLNSLVYNKADSCPWGRIRVRCEKPINMSPKPKVFSSWALTSQLLVLNNLFHWYSRPPTLRNFRIQETEFMAYISQLQSSRTNLLVCYNCSGIKREGILSALQNVLHYFFKHFAFNTYSSTTHLSPLIFKPTYTSRKTESICFWFIYTQLIKMLF